MSSSDVPRSLSYRLNLKTHRPLAKKAPPGWVLADAVLLVALRHERDGSLNLQVDSMDGSSAKEMDHDEVFKVWLALTDMLARSPAVEPGKATFCAVTMKAFLKAIAEDVKPTGELQ